MVRIQLYHNIWVSQAFFLRFLAKKQTMQSVKIFSESKNQYSTRDKTCLVDRRWINGINPRTKLWTPQSAHWRIEKGATAGVPSRGIKPFDACDARKCTLLCALHSLSSAISDFLLRRGLCESTERCVDLVYRELPHLNLTNHPHLVDKKSTG